MLKVLLLLLSTLVVASISEWTVKNDCSEDQKISFKTYQRNFNKIYQNSLAENQALACFCEADTKIQRHNSANFSFTIGHTRDSDSCRKVGTSFPTGYKHDEKLLNSSAKIDGKRLKKVSAAPGGVSINGGLDYSASTSVVKDQKDCGCCWASSANSVLSFHNLHYGTKKSVDFSDQAMTDCVRPSLKCKGGNPLYVFQHVNTKGVPTTTSYPFYGVSGICKSYSSVFKCGKSAYNCMNGNENVLLNLVEKFGPGAICELILMWNLMENLVWKLFSDKCWKLPDIDAVHARDFGCFKVSNNQTWSRCCEYEPFLNLKTLQMQPICIENFKHL